MNTPQEFSALLAALRDARAGAALVTLTRTQGSTFRRAGARMLVFEDGRIVRGLSAGCPERDIAERAREALRGGSARVLRYDREHHGDVLLEMGCGGELEVLVEPFTQPAHWAFAEAVETLMQARQGGVLATVYRVDGATLMRPRHALWSGGLRYQDLDLPTLLAVVDAAIPRVPLSRVPQVISVRDGTTCAEVLLESLQPPLAAWIFGVNASSVALQRQLETLGWQARLFDHQNAPSNAGATVECCAPSAVTARLRADARTFAVVMTHNLERDIDYLRALRGLPLAYLGAVGARRRVARLHDTTGLDARSLHAPAGLDIGSETPEEIALAIAAEMLAVANGASGAALRDTQVPIHRLPP